MKILKQDFEILKEIEELFARFDVSFDGDFKRSDTYETFMLIVIGMIVREDLDGVTSLIRSLDIEPSRYESLVHAFRSKAWDFEKIRYTWTKFVIETGLPARMHGHLILLGDGCKQYHDGKFMAGIQKMTQESETQSKSKYFFGHLYGGIGILLSYEDKLYSVPLVLTIQNGIKATAKWEGSEHPYADESHVYQMAQIAIDLSDYSKESIYYVEDRYFMSKTSFMLLDDTFGSKDFSKGIAADRNVEMIICAKANVHAFLDPPAHKDGQSGRPAKKARTSI